MRGSDVDAATRELFRDFRSQITQIGSDGPYIPNDDPRYDERRAQRSVSQITVYLIDGTQITATDLSTLSALLGAWSTHRSETFADRA